MSEIHKFSKVDLLLLVDHTWGKSIIEAKRSRIRSYIPDIGYDSCVNGVSLDIAP